jgi:hypothetical protein
MLLINKPGKVMIIGALQNYRRVSVARVAAAGALLLTPGLALAQDLDPNVLLGHVEYLASDALAGREAGEPGADSAAFYIARLFESYGLEPAGVDGFLQPFEITTTVAVGEDSRLALVTDTERRELKLNEEWFPFNFSGTGKVVGPSFDAGYGLTDDDFSDFDSSSTPVVILNGGVPDDFSPHTSGIDPSVRRRITLARAKGATAAVVTVSRIRIPEAGDPPHAAGLPVIQVLADDAMESMLADPSLRVDLEAHVMPVRVTGYNVLGTLRGASPALAKEFVAVGAHYDHLGLGGPGSLAPEETMPHNGADDNASGTAAVLGLAEYFATGPSNRPGRSLLFAAFSAEEMGLLGSEFFVSNPTIELAEVSAMLNFDMVGRMRDGKLQVFGTETADEFGAVLDRAAEGSGLALSRVGDGYGPSDHTSFYARKIPVLHFFTGTHSEYHSPADDTELINAEGIVDVASLAARVIQDIGNRDDRLAVVEQERPSPSGGGGYGPYLGTIPDFGEVEGGGLRLSGVRAGSPAEKAGMMAGDVVVEFSDREVLNIYDYTYALRDHVPGDTVTVRVRRGDDEIELTAVLGKRE